MKHFKITEEWLIKQDACEEGMEWWIRNGLLNFPSNRLKDIKGDFTYYISWLKRKVYNCKYDENGNLIHHKDSYGYSIDYKYDENNNLIHTKDSHGLSQDYKYDENGNKVYNENSNGFSQEWK